MEQKIITSEENYKGLDEWLRGREKILLVCDDSIRFLPDIRSKLDEVDVPIIYFSDFKPNPLYESVVKGIGVFRAEGCD